MNIESCTLFTLIPGSRLPSLYFSELDVPLSAAQIQGYFMFYKEDPNAAVKNVHLLKSSKSKIL